MEASARGHPAEEEIMRTVMFLAVGAAILIGCRSIPIPTEMAPAEKNDCLGAGYDRYSDGERATIPDASPAGIAIGPVQTPDDGSALEGVVLEIGIVHESPSDVALWLLYDSDNDGRPEARARLELYRARRGPCADRDPFACPSVLDGTYYFRDEGRSGAEISLSIFDGLASGGSFYLAVADTLPDDVGTVLGWAVYVERPVSCATRPRDGVL
jgi:hypothetical protein